MNNIKTAHKDDFLDGLLALPTIYNAKVSYDGKWVAWSWDRRAQTCEIYLSSTDTGSTPVRLSNTPEHTYLIGWAPDSKSILVKEDVGGNERYRIFRIYIEQPLILLPLIEEDPNYFTSGGELHKNGKWLIYGANIDLTTGREIEPTAVIMHDLMTGERKTLACPARGGVNMPLLSPSGDKVLYSRKDKHPAGSQLWLVTLDGNSDREIINVGDDQKVSGFWLAAGKSITVVAELSTYKRIGIWTEINGIQWILDDPKRQIENILVPYNSEQIIVQEILNARLSASLLDPNTKKEIFFPKLAGTLNPVGGVSNGDWIGTYNSSTHPFDVVRFNMDAKTSNDLHSLSQVWCCTRPVIVRIVVA